MNKNGRPAIPGVARYPSGQIKRSRKISRAAESVTPPSPKIQRARDLFSAICFKGGGQGNHSGDAIGQLWLLGLLDMPDMDETKLLEAARAWWHGRGVMFKGSDYKTARYERASRSSSELTKLTRSERIYARYSSMLLDASEYEQDCLASLMETDIDGLFPTWVCRIIQTELLKHTRLPLAELACDKDYAMLDAAKRALVAMAGVEAVRRAA